MIHLAVLYGLWNSVRRLPRRGHGVSRPAAPKAIEERNGQREEFRFFPLDGFCALRYKLREAEKAVNNLIVLNSLGSSPAPGSIRRPGQGDRRTVASSRNPSTHGQSVTFTATVTSAYAVPGGTVTFAQGATMLGTPTLSGGKANPGSLDPALRIGYGDGDVCGEHQLQGKFRSYRTDRALML